MLKRTGKQIAGSLLAAVMLLTPAMAPKAAESDYAALGLKTGFIKSVDARNFETLTEVGYGIKDNGINTFSNLAYGWGKSTATGTHQWMNYYGENNVPQNFVPQIVTEEGTENKVLQTQYDAAKEVNGTAFQVLGFNPSSSMQAWEVRVKLPSTTAGETRLFYYTNVKSADWGSYRGGVHILAQGTSPIALRDGKVYTANFTINEETTYSHTNPGFVLDNEVDGMTMEAGKWYRIVRMMDLSDSMNHKQKIYLFDENDALIAASDWLTAGSYRHQSTVTLTSANSNTYLSSMSICGQGYTGSVLFDDIDAHELSAPTATIAADKDPNVKVNKVVAVNPVSGKQSKFGTYGTDYAKFNYGRYAIDLYMTEATGEIGLFGLITPKKAWLEKYDPNYRYTQDDSSVVYINNGTVKYSTIADVASLTGSFNNLKNNSEAVSNSQGDVKLEAGKWYSFVLEADLTNNVAMLTDTTKSNTFTLTIVDKETDEAVVNGFTINSTLLRASEPLWKAQDAIQMLQQNGTDKARGWYDYAFLDVAAQGLTAPIYVDNISRLGYDDATSMGEAQTVMDFEVEGCTVGTQLSNTWNVKIAGYDYCPPLGIDSAVNNTVANDPADNPDFIESGRITTNQPANVIITFSEAMKPESVTAENITFTEKDGTAVDGYSVSYDEATNTATLTLGTLEYETDYVLTLTDRVVNTMGIGVASKTVNLTVVNEPVTVTNAHFVNENGVGYNASEALSKDSKVYGKATLTNNSTEASEYLMILVLYDAEGRMVDVATATGTVAIGKTETVTTDKALTVAKDGTKAAVMVWDNWQNMKPRAAASRLPQ